MPIRDESSRERSARVSIWRWLTVGTLAYTGWAVAMAVLAVLFPLLLGADFVGRRPGRRFLRALGIAFLRAFFVGFLPAIRLYRFTELPDRAALAGLPPCVIAANHRSLLDAILLLCLVPRICVPVSSKYASVPLFGRAIRWVGCVPVDRSDRGAVSAALDAVREELVAAGRPVGVFPEGTRSVRGKLLPFQDVFFHAAISALVPVFPMVMHSDIPYLEPVKGTLLTARNAAIRIRLLDPIVPRKGDRSADLSRHCRKRIGETLALLDAESRENA